jgi:electron transfer flavoprotein alpha subunit
MISSLVRKRFSSTLVVIESIKGKALASNLNALQAAHKLGFPITCLVGGGEDAQKAAEQVAKYSKVTKVLVAKSPSLDHSLAEPHADLIKQVQDKEKFSHIVTCHSPYGKNVFPRAAALLNVSPISDVTEIDSADTFKRPIYAGNAIATVKSKDALKMFTVRATAFQPAEHEGGSGEIKEFACETKGIPKVFILGISKWVSEEIAKSDRPELGAAKIHSWSF